MTIDTQLVAIAKACGWTQLHLSEVSRSKLCGMLPTTHPCYHETNSPCDNVPDYISDLNAMHEAEMILSPQQKSHYTELLADICGVYINGDIGGWGDMVVSPLICATASQRATAFLLTVTKQTT